MRSIEMKIQRLNVLLMIVLCCYSCKKSTVPLFEMDLTFDLDIPAGLNTLESHFFIVQGVPTFIESQLNNNGLNIDDVGFINAITANMETRFSGLDLDFVENIGVHLLEENEIDNRREAFYTFNDFVQLGSKTEIAMTPSLLNLKPELSNQTVDLEFKINLRGFLPSELDTRVTMKFHAFPPE